MKELERIKNINVFFAYHLVEELVRQGVDEFFLAPGSRNTPLLYSVAKHPKAKYCVHYDERALAFSALGRAKATGKPTVLVVTSGTAVANTFPAIVESEHTSTPLILISCDRGFNELYNNSNQAIDQTKIFSGYSRQFYQIPTPSQTLSLTHFLSLVSQIVQKTLLPRGGFTHVNFQFQKPLEPHLPTEITRSTNPKYLAWTLSGAPYTTWEVPKDSFSPTGLDFLKGKKALFFIGEMPPAQAERISALLDSMEAPVYSEAFCSPRRTLSHFPLYAEQLTERPDVVIHLGSKIVNASAMRYLTKMSLVVQVSPHQVTDPDSVVSHYVKACVLSFVQGLKEGNLLAPWRFEEAAEKEQKVMALTEKKQVLFPCEVMLLKQLEKWLAPGSLFFIGNSLPIRQFTQFSDKRQRHHLYSNRGASGIDGNIATFYGLTLSSHYASHVLILGDIAFLHDVGSLALFARRGTSEEHSGLRRTDKPVFIFVINNGGGAIFRLLPAKEIEKDIFETCFFTPHPYKDFGALAEQFDLHYLRFEANQLSKLSHVLDEASTDKPTLVEICVSPETSVQLGESIRQSL